MVTPVINCKLFINGKMVESASGKRFMVLNPANNEIIATAEEAGLSQVDEAVQAARKAFDQGPWSRMNGKERSRILIRIANIIRDHHQELVLMESRNAGKPYREADTELRNAADYFEYYASWTNHLYGKTIPVPGNILNYTLREPIGVCGLIVPWNSPMQQACSKIAPALAAGNSVILKPASNTPMTAFRLAELILEEGALPDGVLNIITGPGGIVGNALVSHPLVDKIAFTGETGTGRDIMKAAANTIKKVSLELGGKSPNIVFADANLDEAVKESLVGIYTHSGQKCIARSRLFLEESVYDQFLEQFVERASKIKIGDPTHMDTEMGPVISKRQLETIQNFIEGAKKEGGEIYYGGFKVQDPELAKGNFYLPTVIGNVQNQMRIAQEEIFGPVLSVIRFKTMEDLLEMANDSTFGLAATIWTENIRKAHWLAGRIRAGNISVNQAQVNFMEAPFGGYKQSGFGRERGKDGILLYTQVKNIAVNLQRGEELQM